MDKRRHIKPNEKVGLKLSASERKVILDDLICLEDEYAQVIGGTPDGQSVQFTLDDWEGVGGCVAAEANHTKNKTIRKKLDSIFNKIQRILDTHTDEELPKTIKIEDARKAKILSDQAIAIAEDVAKILIAAEQMGIKNQPLKHFYLSPSQQDVLMLVPTVAGTVKARLSKEKSSFTVAEVAGMTTALAEDLLDGDVHKQLAVLLVVKHLMDRLHEGVVSSAASEEVKPKRRRAKASTATVYQFKITLKEIEPPIWRRIQVKDCTLDKFHEHIQTAMGWTNSHLHQFNINNQLHGDPILLGENFEEMGCEDSTNTRLSEIVPEDGRRFQLEYEYDFGDSWEHEVLFEGCLHAEKGARYPLCVEGERACPPEDVGGTWGYGEYLEAIADPEHERHAELIEWSGPFDPEAFSAKAMTSCMRKGLPNWREEEWI